MPESLGNKSLFSWEECDTCNRLINARFDNDLAFHLLPLRVINRLFSTRKFKHRYGSSQASIQTGITDAEKTPELLLNIFEGDNSIEIYTTGTGMGISVMIPKYSQINLVKAIVRMALFVAKRENLSALEHCRRWLRDEEVWTSPIYWQAYVPTLPASTIGLLLERWVGSTEPGLAMPPYRVMFVYAGQFIGVPIPDSNWTRPTRVSIFPLHLLTKSPVEVTAFELSGDNPEDSIIEAHKHLFPMSGDNINILNLPTHKEIKERAYFLWLERGKNEGSAEMDWLKAEQSLLWERFATFGQVVMPPEKLEPGSPSP